MLSEERRSVVLDVLKAKGFLSVKDACGLLGVCRGTVIRDFQTLADEGVLRKLRGGAASLTPLPTQANSGTNGNSPAPQVKAPPDGMRPFSERKSIHLEAKQRIAGHLAEILKDARTIALDDSSTVFELSQTLHPATDERNIFLVTFGVELFLALVRRNAGFRVALTGGEMHPRANSLVGPMAINSLEGQRFDWAVISARGVLRDNGQIFDSSTHCIHIKRAIMSRATKKILAVDNSKFNKSAPYPICSLSEFDLIVTEDGILNAPNSSRDGEFQDEPYSMNQDV